MTNQEILQKAIEKAEENGYKVPICPETDDGFEMNWWDTIVICGLAKAIFGNSEFTQSLDFLKKVGCYICFVLRKNIF